MTWFKQNGILIQQTHQNQPKSFHFQQFCQFMLVFHFTANFPLHIRLCPELQIEIAKIHPICCFPDVSKLDKPDIKNVGMPPLTKSLYRDVVVPFFQLRANLHIQCPNTSDFLVYLILYYKGYTATTKSFSPSCRRQQTIKKTPTASLMA